jgi:glycosyltransferase involved in cell wall biosynthesis
MASGLPVIAGDVGGVRDLVSESETGWLVQPTVDSLVPALEAARRERSTLPMMGRRARARAEERFDARKNAAAVIDVILESIELHRS